MNAHCLWDDVIDEPANERHNIFLPPHRDAREVYLDAIFFPGRYSAHTILRALNVSAVA